MTDRDCANPQYRKCVMIDDKCKNCGVIEGQPQPCANCGGDCYPTCEEIAESGLTNKEYRKRENREWLQEMRDEEFGMGFQEG